MSAQLKEHGVEYDVLCGVPYTALPIATVMSLACDVGMVMRRKEAKKYGNKRQIEGVWKQGDRCLVVEDLVTSGLSVFETVHPLREAGMTVEHVVVLVDREQGGRANVEAGGMTLHAVLKMHDMLRWLLEAGRIDETMAQKVRDFVAANQVGNKIDEEKQRKQATLKMPFEERASHCENQVAKALFDTMARKQTNLCVSADVTTMAELTSLLTATAPFVCCVKTHADAMEDFDADALTALAAEHDVVIFEDRKFADIGSTVRRQYVSGPSRIASWAPLTNAHVVPGAGVIEGLGASVDQRERAVLVLAQMSSKGALTSEKYTQAAVQMAKAHDHFCIGFIAQQQLVHEPQYIHMTPGVHLSSQGDALGQQYRTPVRVIQEEGNDMVIVGRGIYQADDCAAAAKRYRDAAWNAYLQRLQN
ncbi:MAG: hypothetical protein MHM6MM_006459 [Cercozoa sp. M6MM]